MKPLHLLFALIPIGFVAGFAIGVNIEGPSAKFRKGEHRIVFSSEFCDLLLSNSSEASQSFAVNGVIAACDKFTDVLEETSFVPYTNDERLIGYGLGYVSELEPKTDTMLYLSEGYINGEKNVIGLAESTEMDNILSYQKVTFKKNSMFTVKRNYMELINGPFVPQNVQSYALALHEFGHLLGLKHSSDPNSIMCQGKSLALNDLSDQDIELIQKQERNHAV